MEIQMQMRSFIEGALTYGYAIAGLFFLRFWRISGDRLFVAFAAAFWLFSLNRLMISAVSVTDENRHYLYVIRLFAFVLILVAIADKNRARPHSPSDSDPARPSASDEGRL